VVDGPTSMDSNQSGCTDFKVHEKSQDGWHTSDLFRVQVTMDEVFMLQPFLLSVLEGDFHNDFQIDETAARV
jgi:hypothetical protein